MDPEEQQLAVVDEVAATFFDEAVRGTDGSGDFEVTGFVWETVLDIKS